MNRRTAKNIIGGFIIGIAFTALAGFAWWKVQQSPVPIPDEHTLCLDGQPLAGHTIILVDETDPLDRTQRDRLRYLINAESKLISPYDKITVLAIDSANPYTAQRLFSLCEPLKGSDVGQITANPALVQRHWDLAFGEPLDKALDSLMLVPTSETSPIIEAIKGITWLPDFGPDVRRRRLVVFSDMLQNSRDFSLYRGRPDYEQFLKTDFAKRNEVELRGVTAVIAYVPRPAELALQSATYERFWIDFFRHAGADISILPH